MSLNKPHILPHQIICLFNQTFSIHQFLIHFHSISKKYLNNASPMNYNFSAFLTLDKSRKIIRQKQNDFFSEMIQNIQAQAKLFISKCNDQKKLYKIKYSELDKFIQLFQQRKGQFLYFERGTLKIQQSLSLNYADKIKNCEQINKMKNRMDEFQQKLSILAKKYEQRTNISLLAKLRPKFSNKIQQMQRIKEIIQLVNSVHIQLLQNRNLQLKSQNTNHKSSSNHTQTKKLGDNSSKQKNLQEYKKQILDLKTKYYRLNCKTDYYSQSFGTQKTCNLRKKSSKTQIFKFCTESDAQNSNTVIKQQQTAASQMKYSIRYTQQKKNSKLNTSLSIFDKTTHNASFFVRNSSKIGASQDPNNINLNQNISQKSLNNSSSKFLRKKSSLLKSSFSNNGESHLAKKTNNSVYRQTGFAIQAQRRSNQKRTSTAKGRQSTLKQKTYLLRTSQTQANIQGENNQQQIQGDDLKNNESIMQNQQNLNLLQINDDSQNESETNSINTVHKKTKKGNNRRKGFSKKHIDFDDQNSSNFVPTILDIKKKSSILIDANRQDRGYNRTSFFRTSGYASKKPMMKVGKTRFNNMNKKLGHKDSKQMYSQAMIEQTPTQKAIRTKGILRDRTKKFIKNHQMAVTVKDCMSLYQQISHQSRHDEKCFHPNQFLNMTRQKYDLNYKSNYEDDENETNQVNYFGGLKLRVIETQLYEGQNRAKWTKCENNFEEIQFAKMVSKKINELGQKNLQINRYSWSDQLEVINC